ncbi:hypothetical protein [Roseomonas elaeocarpi]|uniref:Restriction endonuclease n=1 Tax=Roseomonas elaeocarpi TaxID=907779 RepID=A0ABV6JWC1_9PROT
MDWQDDEVLRAINWLTSFADKRSFFERMEAVRSRFLEARSAWTSGELVSLYNLRDAAAWYMFQANAYAQERLHWIPEEAARIVPSLTRIAMELGDLSSISGVEERVSRFMNAERAQPDGGLFELLVALAYKRHGWKVEFVPEMPGIARTYDIKVEKGRRRWAVECKRLNRSGYEMKEKMRGKQLAKPLHELALNASRSVVVQVAYKVELHEVPDDYLVRHLRTFLGGTAPHAWSDSEGRGVIRDVNWGLAHKVLAADDVYYGSSRMIELLVGRYNHDFSHSMAAKWRPSERSPFWAEAVYQASVVSWLSASADAVFKKAGHFRKVVAGAAGQIQCDRPGVVHVGVESWGGTTTDAIRHFLNAKEMRDFDASGSRLRWVYADYLAPEVTTRSYESWAVEETVVSYRIGRHSVGEPLPGHMLLTPENRSRHGVHWASI